MYEKIRNKTGLLSCGDIESRQKVLELTEAVLKRLDSYDRIKSIMRLCGDRLEIGNRSWDLSKKRNVYLIGGGKACNAMAMAVDEILGDRLNAGYAVVKIREDTDVFRRTKVFVGGHPLPNEKGCEACKEILKVADGACPDDLFIAVVSGGTSALMSCPVNGITLEEERITTDIALKSGAGIMEVNSIRRHISQINGGNLAKRIQKRGAELIGIAINDAVGYPATEDIGNPFENYTGTPIGPDETTLEDARRVIKDYNLAGMLPKSVLDYINHCGEEAETPKSFPGNTYFVLNTLPDACAYAKEKADEMGIRSMILTSFLEGESRDAGTFMASIAREIQAYGRPIIPPCFVFCAGETTTKIMDSSLIKGHGGPSHELTASFAVTAAKLSGACMLSIDTEGTDGTTEMAGGLTDSKTYEAACKNGEDLHEALREHKTFEALNALKCSVFTGNTGTNLCDFNVMYVPEIKKDQTKTD